MSPQPIAVKVPEGVPFVIVVNGLTGQPVYGIVQDGIVSVWREQR